MAKREIRIIATRRNGHHAIIFWIGKYYDGSILYINDVYPHQKAEKEFSIPGKIVITPYVGRTIEPCEIQPTTINAVRDIYVKSKTSLKLSKYTDVFFTGDYDCLMLSFEGWDINQIMNGLFIQNHDRWYGTKERIDNMLVLRDPFNCLASELTAYTMWSIPVEDVVQNFAKLWKSHAREFLGQTNLLSNLITVNFNKWHLDSKYRIKLMEKIGVQLDRSPYEYIPDFGNGSSFTGFRKQGRASKLKILDRWRNCKDLAEFRMLKYDKELVDLAEEIFNMKADSIFKKWLEN